MSHMNHIYKPYIIWYDDLYLMVHIMYIIDGKKVFFSSYFGSEKLELNLVLKISIHKIWWTWVVVIIKKIYINIYTHKWPCSSAGSSRDWNILLVTVSLTISFFSQFCYSLEFSIQKTFLQLQKKRSSER